MLGYDVEKLAVMHQPSSENGDSPTLQPKKKRTCDSGSQEVTIYCTEAELLIIIYLAKMYYHICVCTGLGISS